MKILPLVPVLSLLAAPLAALGQVTTVFQDSFTSGALSTLNPTATSPGTLTASRTAYEIASSKSATSTTIASGVMTFGNFSTSSGYCEGQALFVPPASQVKLNTPGQSIEFYYVFTDTSTLFNGNANLNEQVSIGLYNSGGVGPTNGTGLWNSGLSSSLTANDVGCTKGWIGYCAQIAYTTLTGTPFQSSVIYTRPAQTAANNDNQGLCPVSGYSSAQTLASLAGVQGQPALTVGNQYTVDLQITYVNATTVAITNTLYVGAGNGGAVYSAGGFTARYGTTVTGANMLTNGFDSLCIGFRPTSAPTTAETMQINKVTVLLVTPIAPTITGLTNETIVQGTSPTLSPAIAGVPAPALQWYLSTDGGATSNSLPWATGPSLTLTNVQYSQNNYEYYLVATNSQGTISSNMTLSVIVPPVIAGLNNQSAQVGDTVAISPTVTGVPTPVLQWQTNGVNLADGPDANGSTVAGSQTSTLYITNAQAADSVTYSLIASNSAGMVTNTMSLSVASGNQLPVISSLTSLTVVQGSNATFSASVAGVPVPALQWLDQTATPIAGATNLTLTISNVLYSQNGFVYTLVATNIAGSASSNATLTVVVPPAITSQPSSLVVTNTQAASFTVGATGVPAVAYQWLKNGVPITLGANGSAQSATLSIASAAASNDGTYSVTITNQYGLTNSAPVTLTVNSTMSTTALVPANGATGVCYDTPLYVTFSSAPALRNSGKIKIYNVTNTTTPVDTLDMGANVNMSLNATNVQVRTITSDSFTNYPVIITGNTAAIYPHLDLLTSNQTYYVTIDDGVFTDASGAYFVGIGANAWQFTTKAGGPANRANIQVAQDNSGDFVTVQGALDSVPSGNTSPVTINIKNGVYTEIVEIVKPFVTLRGQSRAGTILTYANNSLMNGSTHNRMALKVNASNASLDNLTVTNATPQDASQAEALMIETGAANIVVNNCNIDSYQDTILANTSTSKAYFNNCLIQGDVDFIWGGGNLFFTNCEIRYLTRANFSGGLGPNPSPGSTDIFSNGFSFVSCQLTAPVAPGVNLSGYTIGRTRSITNANMALINCFVTTNLAGWDGSALPTNLYRNWYYNCTNDLGAVVALSNGIPMTISDPNLALASSSAAWLYGWSPALSPNLTTQPVSQSGSVGQTVTFSAAATGLPTPTYQWFLSGTNLPGQNGSTLTIAGLQRSNGGNYYVVASNTSGSVTSSVVTLTYNDTAPVAGPSFTMGALLGTPATVLIVGGKYTPTDADGDPLTVTSITGEINGTATTDGTSITYTATNGTSDSFTYTVSDGFGGTASATVTVNIASNAQGYNQLAMTSLGNGTNVVSFAGIPHYNYALDMATNLTPPIDWVPQITNPAAANGALIFTNVTSQPLFFYRTRYVAP